MSMRKVYRQIARKYGVSLAEVKKDYQNLLDITFNDYVNDGVTESYKSKIPRKENTPTPEEFLTYCALEARRRMDK